MGKPFIIFDKIKKGKESYLEIAGFTTRDVAHTFGVPHAAVQVAVMIEKEKDGKMEPHVLLHQRSKYKKIDPLKWDICGGHIDADDNLLSANEPFSIDNLPGHWKDQSFIEQLFWEAAIREANEETHFSQHGFSFSKKHLHCIGGIGTFSTGFNQATAINREYSSLFLAQVPTDIIQLGANDDINDWLYMEDSVGIDGETVDLRIESLQLMTFKTLIKDYQIQSGKYADGIARVLIRLLKEPDLL